jgi:glycosyltransferase involved in cell wall biosynthesis
MDSGKGVYLSVFFPTFNEEENIAEAVARARIELEKLERDYEIIIVDDASTDRTPQIADKLAHNDAHVIVYHHLRNTKLGGALRTGLYRARGEVIFYTDADNPIDMSDILANLPLLDKYDFVTGYRLNRDETVLRAIYSRAYNFLIRLLFGLKVRDVNFSFKMVKRKVIETVSLHSHGSFIDAELLLEAKRKGFSIGEVGVRYYPRTRGKSTLAKPSIIVTILREMLQYVFRSWTGKQDRERDLSVPPIK